MRSALRKIGKSHGVLIPATLLDKCGIVDDIEIWLDGNRIIIEAAHTLRSDWFNDYQPDADQGIWKPFINTEDTQEDWEW
jgi:antitoxin MazE